MSNKAIDRSYLQRQFKIYDREIVSQKFGQVWESIPTPTIEEASVPTYYNPDQYKMYNDKIIQWTGANTTWGTAPDTVDLNQGHFYKIVMTLVPDADPEVLKYELTNIVKCDTSHTEEYTIGLASSTSTGALRTYQLYKSVNGGPATAVEGSIVDIPKDFLVKSASVVTATTNGGFWFKGVWYEYDNTWVYSEHSGEVPALPTGYTAIFKYTSSNLLSVYTEVDVTDLDSYDSVVDFWPHEVFEISGNAWSSLGTAPKSDFIVGWATATIIAQYNLTVGEKYIDFVINTKDSASGTESNEHLYLALEDLVSNYTAGAGISISSDNIISIKFQYSTLPNPNALGFNASNFPDAIQYVGADDAWGTTNGQETGGTEIASPVKLQLGGFYKYDSTATKWVLINTAKEDIDIVFNINDFS